MMKAIEVRPLSNYRLRIRFDDGTEGDVDLSHLVGKGVFAMWDDSASFQNVAIGSSGQLRWNGDVELCPDALYMDVSGNTPEDVFPNLRADVIA